MSVTKAVSSLDNVVVKSPNDRRLYRVIELENGLCALLIHDSDIYPEGAAADGQNTVADHMDEDEDSDGSYEDDDDDKGEGDEEDDMDEDEDEVKEKGDHQTKKAAAAMCVAMGSFLDPPEAQDLAHFLEHMLFMGSTEFPDENEYDSYLSKHGGASNAYTEMEHTCYHFEIKREFLQGALKRFSQFFVAPLMKTEAMEREVLAVDSEFNQALQNDACRNKKSLSGAMENGVDLRECIMKLYKEYYHGGLMKLVVIGGESLDMLESWVVELIGNVRNGSKIRPTRGKRRSYSLFEMDSPPLRHAYRRGSLHSFLKGKGWATSLSAGVGDDGINRSSLAYIFEMSIHLTDSGLEKIYDIIGYIYQYLKLLRDVSPQEWIFKELQDIGNMDFRYVEEQVADDYATELSENMLAYPVGDYVYQTWDPKMIEDLMGFFTPKNMRIDVVLKSIKSEEFQTEPWFGSRFIEEDVPFQSPPKCIIDEPLMKFWYKLDETFKVPRANTYFRINLKGAYDSVKNCLLTELFINLLKDELNEIVYQATKLETSLSMYGNKLELKVYGFNEKIPALLSKILSIAKSFMPKLDRFKVCYQRKHGERFRNTNMKPLNHSTYLRLQLLCKRIYDSDEKLSVLNDLSLTDLNSFIPVVCSQIFVEALCHGNLSEDEAVNISNIFKNSLTAEPLPVKCRDVNVKNKSETNSVVELYYQIEPEEAQSTKMKAMLDLFHEIVEEPLFNQLRLVIITCFSSLLNRSERNNANLVYRTKEQLGYVVKCGPRLTYRIHGFCFCVQSSKYGPVHLLGRVDNFIKDIEALLEQLDEESFEDYRSGVIARLLEKDPSLLSETNELWSQIVDKRYMFDYSHKEAEELRSIEKKDVIEWYKTFFRESSPKCRRLAVRVWGCNTNMKETQTDPKSVQQIITDAVAFKSTSQFYSSLC
ncbi:hypothetical protein Bca52824_080016 [Brassica carinata]|uniref:Nardilysin-like n=1 Tax=Brassica carinata TaxID=52824 RepID=A0A8X7Q0C4_BRACI|nr:hypothetical protein Bca52824_080016 [Brassica carinata]